MQSLRSIALAAGGIAILGLAALFTMSLTLLIGGLLTVTLVARMIATQMRRAPVPVRAKSRRQEDMRVWNDGRGTIIDL